MTTPQHGELIADRYELLDRIGRGSAAEVWRALDRQSGQHVALKVLHERLTGDPAFVARFRREAQSAAALTHPNIARVYDYGRSGEHYYLAEELIDGSDLQRYLRTNAPLTAAQALNVAAQAAAGVAAAHSTGIVHRGIEPGNLHLHPDGTVKVSDLALARATALSGFSDAGGGPGATAFMSPEQAQGLELTPASDVYSLGAVLYEMLTGRPPFEAATPLAVAMRQQNEDPPPPSSLRPDLPGDIDALTLRALARDPAARFADAAALRAALIRLPQYDAAATVRPSVAPRPAFVAPAPMPPPVPPPAPVFVPPSLPIEVVPSTAATAIRSAPRRPGPGRGEMMTMAAFVITGLLLGVAAVLAVRSLPRLTAPTAQTTATPQAVIVPSFLGRNVQDARRLSDEQGLTVAVEERSDSGAPPGTVIDQEPPAGRTARSGSSVRLVVASQPPEVNVPNVGGMTVDDARTLLSRSGLTVSRTVDRPSPPQDRGRVVAQNPPAGAPVRGGTSVELFTGDGSQTPVPPTPAPTTPPPASPTPAPAAATATPAVAPATPTPRPASPTPGPGGATATPAPPQPTPAGATATPAPATPTPAGATPRPASPTAAPATPTRPAATPGPGAATPTPRVSPNSRATATPPPAATPTPEPLATTPTTPPVATAMPQLRQPEATATPVTTAIPIPPATIATPQPSPATPTPEPAVSPQARRQ